MCKRSTLTNSSVHSQLIYFHSNAEFRNGCLGMLFHHKKALILSFLIDFAGLALHNGLQCNNSNMTMMLYHSLVLDIDDDGVYAKLHSQKVKGTTLAARSLGKSLPNPSSVYHLWYYYTVHSCKQNYAPLKERNEPNSQQTQLRTLLA